MEEDGAANTLAVVVAGRLSVQELETEKVNGGVAASGVPVSGQVLWSFLE